MAAMTQRTASLADVQGLWGLMRQVAGDVPFKMDDEMEQESILSELVACCTAGLSPILVDDEKGIVGALLVRRDDFSWGFLNADTLHVSYAAMVPELRDGDGLAGLFSTVQEKKVPVLASVKAGESLGLSTLLGALGFAHSVTAGSGWGDLYEWTPAA